MEFQVHGPGSTVFGLNLVPTTSKTTWNYFISTPHHTKARGTHQAPPRDTKPGAACPSARSNTGGDSDSTPFS